MDKKINYITNQFKYYIDMARLDHWVKQIFVLPGIIFAILFLDHNFLHFITPVIFGLISTCLIASANYVINEWLDAKFDSYHPTKNTRPAVCGAVSAKGVYLFYIILSFAGLIIAHFITFTFFIFAIVFWLSGVLYNVPPVRTKEKIYIDVLTESLNNPIRLLLGWSTISNNTIPPTSLLLTYWFAGAFLMATKRLSEYRFILSKKGKDALENYRVSFKHYTDTSLLLSSFIYAVLSSFFIAIFLTKYRIEFILALPFFALLFTYYLWLSLKDDVIVQSPEKMYKEKGLILILLIVIILIIILSFVDVPLIQLLFHKKFYYTGNITN